MRERIITAALGLFAEADYAHVSMRMIAAAVGIRAPSLYAHFPSKRALYEAVYADVAHHYRRYFTRVAAEAASDPPLERLRTLLFSIDDYYRTHPMLARFSLRALATTADSEGMRLQQILAESEADLAAVVITAFEDGCADGSFAQHTSAAGAALRFQTLFFTVMDGLFLQLPHLSPVQREANRTRVWASLCEYLTGTQS